MAYEITDADLQFNLMQAELITQLTAANARIAELEAWKAAVPVESIHSLWEEVAYQTVVDELENDIDAVRKFIDANKMQP